MADRLPMVGWYDPGQLARTAVEVLVSTMFGRHADHRVLEALGRQDFTPHDYTKHADGRPRRSIWVDYVGDVGDGWNSTYAVAYALAQPTLPLTAGGQTIQAPRGDILVFGGDQVYPTASNAEYRRRLLAPYETALRRTPEPHPDAFAIPGNHDWYDSLVSFTRQFCSRRWLGGWQTRQTCSYFALKLPRGWWLLGTDVQLGSDEKGVLTIHPIGIQRVPRRWRAAGDPGGLDTSELLPDDRRWTPPALIEPPIPMTRGDTPLEARRRPAAGAPE